MSLEDNLKKAALDYISHTLNIDSIFLFINKYKEHLNYLLESNIISDDEFEDALKNAVLRQARKDYDLVTNKRRNDIYPDHLSMPECFAYAIENGEFTSKELQNIPFGHGETYITFPNSYPTKTLFSDLKLKLLTKKEYKDEKNFIGLSHCC